MSDSNWINPFATMSKYPWLKKKYDDSGIGGIEDTQMWFNATNQFIMRAVVLERIKPVYYKNEELV